MKKQADNKEMLQYKKAVIELITAAIVAMTAFLSLINEGKEVKQTNIYIGDRHNEIIIVNNN